MGRVRLLRSSSVKSPASSREEGRRVVPGLRASGQAVMYVDIGSHGYADGVQVVKGLYIIRSNDVCQNTCNMPWLLRRKH